MLEALPEERFDRITRMAARLFETPIALISLVDGGRVQLKSRLGLALSETACAGAFCAHTILEGGGLLVPDALLDPRFADSPLVAGPPHLRFYAGLSLSAPDGSRAGTLCVMGDQPRGFGAADWAALRDLAAWAERELRESEPQRDLAAWAEREQRCRSVVAAIREGIVVQDADGSVQTLNASAERMLGLTEKQMIGGALFDRYAPPIREDGSPFPPEANPILLSLRTGRPCTNVVLGLPGPEGQPCWISVNTQPMFREGEPAPYAVVCTLADITERKQAEQSQREANDRFRVLVEGLPVITYIAALDELSSTIYTSPQIESLLGFTQAEWMADHRLWFKQIHPDDQQRVLEDNARLHATNVSTPSEYRMLTRGGKVKWFRDAAVIVRDEAGQPRFMQGMMFDITERKATEAALQESEERYRNLVDCAQDVIFTLGLDGSITSINPSFEISMGWSSAEWLGRSFDPLVHGDDRHVARAAIARALAGERPEAFDLRVRTAAGGYRHGEFTITAQVQHGAVVGVLGIGRDIAERRQAEAALRISEARNRALIDALPDLMFRLSRDGVYLDYKADRLSDLFLPPEQFLDRTIYDVMPPELARQFHDCIAQALQTAAVQVLEYQLTMDGAPRDFEARVVVCGEHEVLMIVREITERKNVERMKNEFVSTVSHELRTPLTSIRGSLGLIAGGVTGEIPEKARTMVDIAYKNSERLVRLINDILDIEKIESGKMTFKFRPVNLGALVEQAVETNRGYGRQFNVTFTFENEAADARVNVDDDRLIQALTNLLSNAAKFSPPEDSVSVSVQRLGGLLRIAIRDHGTGIPETFRGRLFEKFAQADSSDTRQKGGTGLGLSISKAIVEKLGGQIDCQSRLGRGTTFFVDLPEWHELAPDQAPAAGARPTPAVLVCERDPDVAALLAMMLGAGGFAADLAHSAAQAHQLLGRREYSALILDAALPGPEILLPTSKQSAQPINYDLPIVVISGRDDPSRQVLRSIASSVVDWIVRPIDQLRLLAAVEQAVGRPAQARVERV
ncbi:MAG: PAS domain S-box protein [Kouleothrix sp.]|nr:PAS domain S-box protein [Kouleothrix sp.]